MWHLSSSRQHLSACIASFQRGGDVVVIHVHLSIRHDSPSRIALQPSFAKGQLLFDKEDGLRRYAVNFSSSSTIGIRPDYSSLTNRYTRSATECLCAQQTHERGSGWWRKKDGVCSNATRYVAVRRGPKYLACYEVTEPEAYFVAESPEWEAVRKARTPMWSEKNQRTHDVCSRFSRRIHPHLLDTKGLTRMALL